MKSNEQEVKKVIENTISNYQTQIDDYQNKINKLKDALSLFTENSFSSNGKAHSEKKIKKPSKVKLKTKKEKIRKLPVIKWDETLMPFLRGLDKPVTHEEIYKKLFKGRRSKYKKMLSDRLYTALNFMMKKGHIKSIIKDDVKYYGTPEVIIGI